MNIPLYVHEDEDDDKDEKYERYEKEDRDEKEDKEDKYCNSKMMSPFREIIETKTSILNDINQHNSPEAPQHLHVEFSNICNTALPKYSKNRVLPNTWIASPRLQFLPNQIVLLALSNAPVRCLAVIIKDSKDTAKDVVEGLKYSIMKICKKKLKREQQPRLYVETPSNGKASGYLYTSRRGFYFVHKKTYDLKMTAIKHKNGDYEIKMENIQDINEIFFTKVDGMHLRPDKGFRRLKEDIGMEQFLLEDYPTPEWKRHVNGLKEENKEMDKGRFHHTYNSSPDTLESSESSAKRQKKTEEPLSTCPGRFLDVDGLFDKGFNRYTRLTDTMICNYDLRHTNNTIYKPEYDDADDLFL